jgi:N-acyl homoserine lactone hydrolase
MSDLVKQIHPLYSGQIQFKGDKDWLPVFSFLIETKSALLLFDSGFHPELATDPRARLGGLASVLNLDIERDNGIDAHLQRRGLKPSDIDAVLCSHLHFDHCGGLEFFAGKSRLIVQASELTSAFNPKFPFEYIKRDFDFADAFETVEGDVDLFGDGSVLLLFTPGHCTGHQSVLLAAENGTEILLLGDAAYTLEQFQSKKNSKYPVQKEVEIQSIERLHHLIAGSSAKRVDVYAGHDRRCLERERLVQD